MGGDPRRPADESSIHLDRQELGTPGPDEFARRRRRWFTAIGAACALFLLAKVPWMPYQPFCWQMWPYSVIEGERIPVPDWLERNGFFEDLGYTIKGQMTEGFAQYVAGVFKSQRIPVVRSGNLVLVPVFERYLLYDELPDGNASAMDVFANHLPPDYPNWAAMSQEMRVRIRDLTDHPFGRERFRSGVFGDCEAARALIMENDGW